jgi:hypothetical protein
MSSRFAGTFRIDARPGHVTGTVHDPQGRPPAGAGVLIRGTTYAQGQQTSFETTTGADGTYALRVSDGRYEAKAWIDFTYDGTFYSRHLHPLSGNSSTQIDSAVGGNLDFQWRLTGLNAHSTPPGHVDTDFYGVSIELSYCGLPAGRIARVGTTAFLPDGSSRPFLPGLDDADVSYESLEVRFALWEGFHARSYSGGGITPTTVYVRD